MHPDAVQGLNSVIQRPALRQHREISYQHKILYAGIVCHKICGTAYCLEYHVDESGCNIFGSGIGLGFSEIRGCHSVRKPRYLRLRDVPDLQVDS